MGSSHFSKKKYSLFCFKQACKYLLQYSSLMPHSTAFFALCRTGCNEQLLVLLTQTHCQYLGHTWTVSVVLLPMCLQADQTFRLIHISICSNNMPLLWGTRPAELQENWSPRPALARQLHVPHQSCRNKRSLSSGRGLYMLFAETIAFCRILMFRLAFLYAFQY